MIMFSLYASNLKQLAKIYEYSPHLALAIEMKNKMYNLC